jgi:hypothetical protein
MLCYVITLLVYSFGCVRKIFALGTTVLYIPIVSTGNGPLIYTTTPADDYSNLAQDKTTALLFLRVITILTLL